MTEFRITSLALAAAALVGALSMASAPASARGFSHGGMYRSHGFGHRHFGGHRRFGHRHWHGRRWGYRGYGYRYGGGSCWRWRYGERVWVCGGGGGGYSIRRIRLSLWPPSLGRRAPLEPFSRTWRPLWTTWGSLRWARSAAVTRSGPNLDSKSSRSVLL